MEITTSKQFAIDAKDLLKGAAVAGATAGMAIAGKVLELWLDSPSFSIKDISYALVLKAAFAGFAGYLAKNFFTPSKIIIKPSPPETIKEVEDKIENTKIE